MTLPPSMVLWFSLPLQPPEATVKAYGTVESHYENKPSEAWAFSVTVSKEINQEVRWEQAPVVENSVPPPVSKRLEMIRAFQREFRAKTPHQRGNLVEEVIRNR